MPLEIRGEEAAEFFRELWDSGRYRTSMRETRRTGRYEWTARIRAPRKLNINKRNPIKAYLRLRRSGTSCPDDVLTFDSKSNAVKTNWSTPFFEGYGMLNKCRTCRDTAICPAYSLYKYKKELERKGKDSQE